MEEAVFLSCGAVAAKTKEEGNKMQDAKLNKNKEEKKLVVVAKEPSRRTQRRNLGRSARRRRKKWLELERAELELLLEPKPELLSSICATESDSQTATATISAWPVVSQLRRQLKQWLSPADDVSLQAQLGNVPNNAIGVVTRVGDLLRQYPTLKATEDPTIRDRGDIIPVVLQLYPIAQRVEHAAGGKQEGNPYKSRKRKRTKQQQQQQLQLQLRLQQQTFDAAGDTTTAPGQNGNDVVVEVVMEPFPTLYWLTHPLLKIWVSRLEVQGYGVQFETRLQNDPVALQSMRRAHTAYAQHRNDLLLWMVDPKTEEDDYDLNNDGPHSQQNLQHYNSLTQPQLAALSVDRGIAGMTNFAAVKCLHAHAAHALSEGPGAADNVVGQWVMEQLVLVYGQNRNHGSSSRSNTQPPRDE